MDCLALSVSSILKRRYTGSRLGYRQLSEEDDPELSPVTVVVGKEKREFLVDPFVLEENPFRVLMEMVRKQEGIQEGGDDANAKQRGKKMKKQKNRVMLVGVDAILFEHMLWLMHNDCSSLFQLNLEEVIDFYANDF